LDSLRALWEALFGRARGDAAEDAVAPRPEPPRAQPFAVSGNPFVVGSDADPAARVRVKP